MSTRETPTAYSRTLHRTMKDIYMELVEQGYPKDTIYLVVMDAMMRLAYEELGEKGATALLEKLREI